MLSTYSLMNIVVYYPILDSKNGRVYRTILFLSNTFIPIIPIVHCSFINIDDNYITIVQVLSIFFIIAFFGCFMYMYRIPETLIDLRYLDYIGNSHNIMHVLVVIIALQIYYGLKILF
jgi:archaellum biogenesis protein FlaJ (TadC family)